MLKRYSLFLTVVAIACGSMIVKQFTNTSIDHIAHIYPHEKPFVVVIPSFNNKQWYAKNLDILWQQNYHNFRVIYIDDCSQDGTGDLVAEYIRTHPAPFPVQFIRNEQRRGALANIYNAVHSCKDYEIVITYDGDDRLAHANVLPTLNQAYIDEPILMTYGQYVTLHRSGIGICRDIPPVVVKNNLYRKYPWVTSHLRSFYAGLFKKINKEDLMINGDFFAVTWDQAFMFPMLEMAAGRYKFIQDILYVYNDENPINDWKVRLPLMQQCERIIHARPAYQPLPATYTCT
jgi:glycosyltransferase involved in cell wall biosynthesis